MNLLFDENLSPSLAHQLQDIFPGSIHVHDCGLGQSEDTLVWQYAKANVFMIVSKDSDFQYYGLLHGPPPQFIWIRIANCTTAQIESLIRTQSIIIHEFGRHQLDSTLILS